MSQQPQRQASRLRNIGDESRHDRLLRYGLLIFLISVLVVAIYRVLRLAIRKLIVPRALHRLHQHSLSLDGRFKISGDISTLSEAISTMRTVVRLTPDDDICLLGRLIHLGRWLDARYDHTHDLADLGEYIATQQRLALLTPEDDTNFPAILNNIGISFHFRYEITREITDLTESISAKELSVQSTPEGHPSLTSRLKSLAYSFEARFEATGNVADSDGAISARMRTVDLAQGDNASLPQLLNGVGNSYDIRFKSTEDISDIDEAIVLKQKAIDLIHDDYPGLFQLLSSLAISFLHRFGLTDDLADNTNSIEALERSIDLAPEGDARVPRLHSQLGCAYQTLFDRTTTDISLIDKAIASQRKSLELSLRRSPDLLYNLGTSFRSRFARSGDISDIAEAIVNIQQSLELIDDGDAFLPQVLNSLATAFRSRFERTRHVSDIDEAVSLAERAIRMRGDDHPELPQLLSNLGCSLQSRFLIAQSRSDIDEAISAHQRAVEKTSPRHADLPGRLCNLAISHNARFKIGEDAADIEKAIESYRTAVKVLPKRHSFRPHLYNNLGIAYASRFNVFGDISNIDEAVLAGELAVNNTPEGHAERPHRLINLGNSLYLRSLFPGHEEDFDLCLSHFSNAATSGVGHPRSRLEAAKLWSGILVGCCPDSSDIIPAFDTAINLLTQLACLEQTVRRRYIQLEGISGLTLDAAAEAFRLERPEKALEWLEQGRCMVWNQIHSLRTPVDELAVYHPELAQRLSTVGQQLDVAGSSTRPPDVVMSLSSKIAMEDVAREHINLAKKWENVLQDVRKQDGFQDFLCPPQSSTLMAHLPPEGYVIVINVGSSRCDAICISQAFSEPLHVPLPDFSSRKADRYLVDLRTRLEKRQQDVPVAPGATGNPDEPERDESGDKDLVRKMLQGLWKWLVKPILDALEISRHDASSSPGGMPPRVWWCPTGDLSFLPIHAAGIYRKRNSESVFDYVVSSYIPTVTTLTTRVRTERLLHECQPGLFLTSQPKVEGAREIPMTTVEVNSVYDLALEKGVSVSKVEGDELSVEECLERMERYSSIHLACHASRSAEHPLENHFLFHQGSLSLGAIIQKDLKNADLAYLSACHTGAGEENLSEEAVHLAAGMLAAGYRRSVATMWSVGDQRSLQVTKDFYQYLWATGGDDSGRKLDGKRSAHALHHAVQRLRAGLNLSEGSILAWASYVHFGY